MKSRMLLTLPLICSLTVAAQTVYKVPADTKGNEILLTIENQSSGVAAHNLTVALAGDHPGLQVSPLVATVKSLQPSGTSNVAFAFTVGRDVRLTAYDTLHFVIKDLTGGSWAKDIIVQYVGPQEYKLDQNFPNPFNPTTSIYYDLPVESRVSIVVYDILGRQVARLVDEVKEAGYQTARWDAHNVASGAYIYRMMAQPSSGGKVWTNVKKLMVMK